MSSCSLDGSATTIIRLSKKKRPPSLPLRLKPPLQLPPPKLPPPKPPPRPRPKPKPRLLPKLLLPKPPLRWKPLASSLSVVEKNLLKVIVEAARNSPELLQGAADQIAEKIGN